MTTSDDRAGTAGGERPLVVVGVDGSAASRDVLVSALVAAARRGADLEVVSSVAVELCYVGEAPMVLPDLGELRSEASDRVRALVDEVRADAAVSAVPGVRNTAVRLTVSERPPAPDLVDRSRNAILLVVGSRGRGAVRSALLGSVALSCATHAACPVVIVRPSPVATHIPPRVVVGVDGSSGSRAALAAAVEEAALVGGEVEAVSTFVLTDYWTDLSSVVVPPLENIRGRLREQVVDLVDAVLAERSDGGAAGAPDVRIEVLEGPPGEVLTERSLAAHLLVVGSRGRGAFRALLLGSVALHCAVRAECPVMVVRAVADRPATTERSGTMVAGF
jgi:nucleotide-binding universal stress UspA family protein